MATATGNPNPAIIEPLTKRHSGQTSNVVSGQVRRRNFLGLEAVLTWQKAHAGLENRRRSCFNRPMAPKSNPAYVEASRQSSVTGLQLPTQSGWFATTHWSV